MSVSVIPKSKLIDGKAEAAILRTRIGAAVTKLKNDHNLTPGLAVVLVGEDSASEIYVRNKGIATKQAGMNSYAFRLPADTSQEVLLNKVRALNDNPDVHGILVQFPVPEQMSQQVVIDAISPDKDVDGLHPINAGRLVSGLPGFTPCTPLGSVMLVKQTLGDLSGKHAVVIGRSNLVGKPIAQVLLKENCTVTIAHSRTQDLASVCKTADILVAAVGIPELVKRDWVKSGACVIDVGINRVPQNEAAAEKAMDEKSVNETGRVKTKLVGDVATAEVAEVAGYITPVPGGVGPMTIACLLLNTLTAACHQHSIEASEIEV